MHVIVIKAVIVILWLNRTYCGTFLYCWLNHWLFPPSCLVFLLFIVKALYILGVLQKIQHTLYCEKEGYIITEW